MRTWTHKNNPKRAVIGSCCGTGVKGVNTHIHEEQIEQQDNKPHLFKDIRV